MREALSSARASADLERERDQLREAGEPVLGVLPERARRGDQDEAPDPPARDHDRRADRGPVAALATSVSAATPRRPR